MLSEQRGTNRDYQVLLRVFFHHQVFLIFHFWDIGEFLMLFALLLITVQFLFLFFLMHCLIFMLDICKIFIGGDWCDKAWERTHFKMIKEPESKACLKSHENESSSL
jgi:hypothetical protein